MSILTRYWLKEFAGVFFIVQIIVMCIFVSVDYLTNLDTFLESDLSLLNAFGYVLLKTPFMFVQLTPACLVLGVIVVFGMMNRNNELLAVKSGGISVFYLVRPAFIAGVTLAVMMFFLGETLVPVTMSQANHIKYSVIKKRRNMYAVRENIWIKANHSISHFKYFNPIDHTISGITMTFFNNKSELIARIDAETGRYETGKWHLFKGIEQTLSGESGKSSVEVWEKKQVTLDVVPDDLRKIVKKSNEMSFKELAAHVRKVEREGYDATTYRVDLFGKTAFPFICIIMAIIGSAGGMRSFVKNNLPLGITIGICASFFYWIMYGFCTSLGYGRMLPPFISAWTTNFFFMCGGLIFLIQTE